MASDNAFDSAPDANADAAPQDAPSADLSALLISLLKTVLYRDEDERRWLALLRLQAPVRDYAAILNLDLLLDEAEGYAFLKGRPDPDASDSSPRLPRLVARRPLTFSVSLLLALLRKKLAEFDAGGGQDAHAGRLVLTREDMIELVRVFLPDGSNEAKHIDQLETSINKVVELGFLRKLKPTSGSVANLASYEVRRILKAFVDAQWLAQLDARLAQYQAQLILPPSEAGDTHE